MRNELEQIEKIEQYLQGQLPAAEKAAFETEMAGDVTLREAVQLQQEIMRGIGRAALRQQVEQAGKQFRQWRNVTRWGSAGLGIVVVVAAVFYFSYKSSHHGDDNNSYHGNTLPIVNELGEKQWADADRNIAAQAFLINTGRDTVIETKGGMVLSIPSNGFLDENGQPATGKIDLVVKEALDPAAIMKAGLSSKSGNQLLESGGMFFIDARQGGRLLKIDSAHGIYAELPADTVRAGMQLYRGRRMKDGTIDWVNPTPLNHDLLPVDIHSLHFYPPTYLDSLKSWGYDIKNKKFTDSLYYSFARLFAKNSSEMDSAPDYIPSKNSSPFDNPDSSFFQVQDSTVDRGNNLSGGDTSLSYYFHECAINPAKIKTIWSDEYQNTLLSTHEFEERLYWLHRIGNNVLLDLYVNNLDKSLYDIDMMVFRQPHVSDEVRDVFLRFAARHDGKVKAGQRQLQRLREYYEMKTRAYTEAIAKAQNKYWSEQDKLGRVAGLKAQEHWDDSAARVAQNFEEEVELNYKEAIRQLGYDTSISPPPSDTDIYTDVYQVQITFTGWCNVDRAVTAATSDRITLDYMDVQTGKKAVIQYLPVSLQVSSAGEYDQLYVYLLPDQLNSFMRLPGSNGKYAEKLDELMRYKLVCIGYKGEQAFFYSMDTIQPKDYPPVSLTPIGGSELDQQLNRAGNKTQAAGLLKENAFFNFERVDQKRRNHNRDLEELSAKLMKQLFPCYIFQEHAAPAAEPTNMEEVPKK